MFRIVFSYLSLLVLLTFSTNNGQGQNCTIAANIITIDASCGLANGSIDIQPYGGYPPYMYSINVTAYQDFRIIPTT